MLRGLVVVASIGWLAFAPPGAAAPRLAALLATFALYSLGLLGLLWTRPDVALRLALPVLGVDLLFALLLIALTGGARSVFYLALYLIAALQAYYHGMRRGVAVAGTATALYLLVIWPTAVPAEWPDYAVRVALLLLAAVGLGVLGRVEAEERERIRALNRELAARERFTREVVDSLREGVVVLDRQGRITGWNRALELRCGIPASEALGRPFFDVFPGLGGEGLRAAVEGVAAGREEGFVLERLPCETPRGRVVLDVKGGAVRGPGDGLEGLVLLVEDVTERVTLEESVRQADKLAAIGTLAAGLAHEVNNPIGVIGSRVELMLEDAERHGLPA